MDFAQSPVLVEFVFGLALMAVAPLARFGRLRSHGILLLGFFALAAIAWFLAAPFSFALLMGLFFSLLLTHPLVSQSFSWIWATVQPVPLKPWFLPLVAAIAGLFLITAPAHIMDLIDGARTKELEAAIFGQHSLIPLQEMIGFTDQNQVVCLYFSGSEHEGNDIQWLREHDFDFQLMRLEGADNESNCHGHVFTGGRYWILGRDVPAILRDNGYIETAQPAPGDIVVYRDGEGVVTHTGIVRAAGPGFPILVESKWGQFGVYIHPADRTPYAGPIAYYHTNRRAGNHLITIKENGSPK